MYKVTFTSVRPRIIKQYSGTELGFHRYDDDMYDYIDEVFISTGKMLAMKISMTEDKLTQYIEMMFDSKQDWVSYQKDSVILYHEPIRVKYNAINKIAVSINVEEIIVTKDLYNLYVR
jgi:hypothetical protein